MTAFQMPEFLPALPEMLLLGLICGLLMLEPFLGARRQGLMYLLAQAALAAIAIALALTASGTPQLSFHGAFVRDAAADLIKYFILLAVAGVFLYGRGYLFARGLERGEFYLLGLFATLGMMVMVSGASLLTLYLGLELLSLSIYAMVAVDRDNPVACEAAMKYFVLGALASGVLLYGMSLLYGLTGSLGLQQIAAQVGSQGSAGPLSVPLAFALVFVVAAIAFKLSAAPFHMWAPDVYQGAPTPVTLLIGSAPKLAAFALVLRLLVEGLGALQDSWQDLLVVLSVLSLAVGNVIAIAQTSLKRMLAYSTISHIGFLLLGVLSGTHEGLSAALFYALTYALTVLAAFGIMLLLSRAGFEASELDDYRGLNDRSPWYALLMLIVMLSMAGVPPTVGFYAKLLVLQAVVRVEMVWLAAVAVGFAVIGAFYYLRLIKLMYFDAPQDTAPISGAPGMQLLLGVNAIALLVLGLFPGGLVELCLRAMS